MPFNNVKDLLPDVKCDTPPPSPSPSPSHPRPILNIKEKKKPPKNKDIFVFTNNKMETTDTDNVKIVSAETIEKEAKEEAAIKPAAETAVEPEPSSPKRRHGDRGRDKKAKRKSRYPNGIMPPERLAQLALARTKALKVRKERALQRKAEKKREQNARYNHPAPPPPAAAEPQPVQQRQSQPIAIPQPKAAKPKVSREQANEAFFGLLDQWDNRRQARKKQRKEAEVVAKPKPIPKPLPKAPSIYGNRNNNNNMNWDNLFF
jgi:hypothetical protein